MYHRDILKYLTIVSALVSLSTGLYQIATNTILGIIFIISFIILVIIYFYFWKINPFEFHQLESCVELDIVDNTGAKVIITKTTNLMAIKNNVSQYVEEMASDDGYIDDFKVSQGTIENVKTFEGGKKITTTFIHPLKKKESIVRKYICTFYDVFVANENYWNLRIHYPTDIQKIKIRFPQTRPFKSFKGIVRYSTYEKMYKVQPKESIEEGRPTLDWIIKEPRVGKRYRIDWVW